MLSKTVLYDLFLHFSEFQIIKNYDIAERQDDDDEHESACYVVTSDMCPARWFTL